MKWQRIYPYLAWVVCGVAAVSLAFFLPGCVQTLRATHGALATYAGLILAANRQDLAAIPQLCTAHYLASHPIVPAKEGGIVGLPRNIDKNFQAWREDQIVYLCPTNRVGPVYRFLSESGAWKFDGPAGLLRSGGRFLRSEGDDIVRDSP